MVAMPDGREAIWGWSDRVLNRNRAVDTLASFMAFKGALPVELMLLPPRPLSEIGQSATASHMAAIKAMGPSDTLVLYHWTKSSLSELARRGEPMVNFQKDGLQQRFGPTLAVEPEGGF